MRNRPIHNALLLMGLCAAVLGLRGVPAAAQDAAEVNFFSKYYGRFLSSIVAGTVTVELSETPSDFTERGCATGDTVCGHWEGTSVASLGDLDLQDAQVQQGCCDPFGMTSTEGFGILLACRGGRKCVTQRGRFTGYDTSGLNPNGTADSLVVSCPTEGECTRWLEGLRGPSVAVVRGPTYVAFAQSGGFDANGAWGVGIHPDLNQAVGAASQNCAANTRTSCGNQGYCLLNPGLFGAWASDLKVAGHSAYACNLETAERAKAQVQAWCGDGCSVLWTGGAK